MRFVYLDESGTGPIGEEPWLVVAGVIIEADHQWRNVENHLHSLADQHVAEAHRERFVFHAAELFSGGKTFAWNGISREERWKILDALVAVPALFSLPVIFACVDRKKAANSAPKGERPAKTVAMVQAVAYTLALYQVECWMRTFTHSHEVAAVVVEDNDNAREMIRSAHDFVQAKHSTFLKEHRLQGIAVRRIIETPHFNNKRESSPLQLADVCAFAIKRRKMGKPHSERFYDPLVPQMLSGYRTEL
jgi:hypothetical protein